MIAQNEKVEPDARDDGKPPIQTSNSERMNIYKLLTGIFLVLLVSVACPYAVEYFGYMPKLNQKAWVVLIIASMGLCTKVLIGDVVSGEFLFYKFGYDNCIMSFGSVLGSLSMQMTAKSDVDLFPGIDSITFLKNLPRFSHDVAPHRSIQLFVLLLFSLLGTLITASISSSIKQKRANADNFLSLINSIIGTTLLAMYVLILVTKG